MIVELPIDGNLEVSFKDRYRLVGGIPGVTGNEYFLLVPSVRAEPFHWLVNEADPRIFLLVLEPELVVSDYKPQLDRKSVAEAGLDETQDFKLYCIVNFADPDNPTINLRSPIIFGMEDHVGRQIILPDEKYEIRTPLLSVVGA